MASDSLVLFEGVTVRRGALTLLDNVCAEVPRGGSTMIIGPNGAGKTTLLLALLGDARHEGLVRFIPAAGKKGRLRLGYVPQHLHIDRGLPLTVMEFLCAGAQRRPLWLGIAPSARRRAQDVLECVQGGHLASRRLGALSGGELQRVLLALALQQEPDLLVLDEPAAGMDFQSDHIFCEMLEGLRARHSFTQLMVSHDLGMVAHHATHVICLKRAVVAEGPPQTVFTDATMTTLFGMHKGIMPWPYCPPPVMTRTATLPDERGGFHA